MIEYPAYSLAGRRVLVTGASSGIGIPLAVEAARRGASLILSGRDEERLVQTAELCVAESGDGPMPELLALDLIDLDERRALAAACQDVDVAVLNAGLLLGGPFERHDDERILALLRLNVEAPLHLARLLGLAPGVEKRQSAPGVETALLPDEDSLRRGVATK
jgi:short-subunit dehydrogenase